MALLGFGELIRDARQQRGWNQAELAEHVGAVATTVSRWETEQRRPSIEEGNALVLALALKRGR